MEAKVRIGLQCHLRGRRRNHFTHVACHGGSVYESEVDGNLRLLILALLVRAVYCWPSNDIALAWVHSETILVV